jgi:hypothetical protein
MRRIQPLVLAALLFTGCNRDKVEVRQTLEEAPALLSTVPMGDAKAAAQLVAGFHEIEDNAWRWTQREFSVNLGVPAGAQRKGATLSLSLTVPPVVIAKLGTVTLTASIGGTSLASQTYSRAGSDTYKREVPPGLLGSNPVRVDFHLDKAMPPGGGDMRELGIVTLSAGLESK